MAIVTTDNKHYAAIANKIREKNTGTDGIFPSDMPEQIDLVYENGKKAEYDRFWDTYQQNGTRSAYDNFFRASGWNDETYNPKYEIRAKSLSALFHGSGITDTKVPIIYEGTYNSSNVFYGCSKLVTICNLTFVENPVHSNYSNWFYNCTALENIAIDGVIGNDINFQWSTKLTKESIKSIMTHLSLDDDAPNESGKWGTVTLSLEAVDREFVYVDVGEEEIIGSESPEWMALLPPGVLWDVALI
jgi:hypothetical protein